MLSLFTLLQTNWRTTGSVIGLYSFSTMYYVSTSRRIQHTFDLIARGSLLGSCSRMTTPPGNAGVSEL